MKYLPEQIHGSIESVLEERYESVVVEIIDKFIEFFNSVTELREEFPDYDENLMTANVESAKKVSNDINNLIAKHYQKDDSLTYSKLFPGLSDELSSILFELKREVRIEQSNSRFKINSEDIGFKGFVKRIKILTFKTQNVILKPVKTLLPKTKKEKFKTANWKHRIPLRNIGYYFLRDKLIEELSIIYDNTLNNVSKKSVAYWNYDESFDKDYVSNFLRKDGLGPLKSSLPKPESIISELEKIKGELKTKIFNSLTNCEERFNYTYERVGTIELSKLKFNSKKVYAHNSSVEKQFNKFVKDWDNTLYSLGEDWGLNYDLHSIRYSTIGVYFKLKKSLNIKNKIQVFPQFNEISGSLNFILEKLKQPATELQKIERVLAFLRENLQKALLSSVIPNLINTISDLKFPEMIDESVTEVSEQINSIQEKRAFVRTSGYDKKLNQLFISEIYPREIISFKAFPKLADSFKEIKTKTVTKLKEIQSELIHLGNMADFSLESAINAALVEKQEKSEIKTIALEGINISLTKQENLLATFSNLINESLSNVRRLIAEFNDELYNFTRHSNIAEIRSELMREKKKSKVKEVKESFFSSIKNFVPNIFNRIKNYYKEETEVTTEKRKAPVISENRKIVSKEATNPLVKLANNQDKLPYIYRRLFQITPLENERLYISRKAEEDQLETAYRKWLLGGYAPVIVSAEKGSGLTSFLNLFLKRIESKTVFRRINVKPTIFKTEDLLKLFEKIFINEKFLNVDDLINYLNDENNKQVIAIENLQHMYLRNLRGFECLKLLTQIISKTSKNIFWITTCTLYANQLLNKTIKIDDTFGYQIQLRQIPEKMITELIKKRNSISGYNLEFKPDPLIPRKKEFNRLPYKQKQNLLEQDFFNTLNKFAQSNISLALMFWLEAINEIQERNVYVNADFEISSSALNLLSQENLFLIQSLILHDGLRVQDLAKTINYSVDETSQLLQNLQDDNIITKSEDVYMINPILYRRSVNILKTKNLI